MRFYSLLIFSLIILDDENDDCAICLTNTSAASFALKCRHVFHKDCLREWVENGRSDCPLCRGNMDSTDFKRLTYEPKFLLLDAVRTRNLDLTKTLLDGNQTLMHERFGNNKSIFLIACEIQNNDKIIRMLLNRSDVNVNEKSAAGWTALHKASYEGSENLVEMLVKRPDILVVNDAESNEGNTALQQAAGQGHANIVRLLLSRSDIDVNKKDEQGWTALHWAAYSDHEEVIKLLLQRSDIRINEKTVQDSTPLLLAAMFGRSKTVALLLQHPDIKLDEKEVEGKTPLQCALEKGFQDVALMISRKQQSMKLKLVERP